MLLETVSLQTVLLKYRSQYEYIFIKRLDRR